MDVITNKEELLTDLQDLCNLFGISDMSITHEEVDLDGRIINKFKLGNGQYYESAYDYEEGLTALAKKSLRKKQVKIALYDLLSTVTKKTLPWGSLTGVRPTKFARDMIERGEIKDFMVADVLEKTYRVSRDKARLTAMTLKNQKCIIRNDNLVDLYVNIPICPTRCLYCSFISNELSRVKDRVEIYIDCLLKEIEAIKKIVSNKAYIIRTIYIGGGTPSVLTAEQLNRLLDSLTFPVSEFTVECGRPDTITVEKLDVLKAHNVTRISVNPQTFCEATLKRIGRKHKNSEVLEGYSMALERGLKVNMDVIAGLPKEKLGIFKRTMQTLIDLSPENITVHTLSVKNGALLKEDTSQLCDKEVDKMVSFAQKLLFDNGYKPYYMYRQKNQLGGLENVGYFRDDNVCIFNIDSMEETNSIIAVGAGAMSKRVFNNEKRIERQDNVKFIEDYIARIDEMIERKKKFFS